ncbi:MAG: SPOR domain-containing protein, partial [Betaproteobacteria bacterium]
GPVPRGQPGPFFAAHELTRRLAGALRRDASQDHGPVAGAHGPGGARAKLQLLGYASYTQDVDSPTGKRTRVRVGPFKSRAEAEAVAARVKTAGLQAAVLAL